MYVQRRCEDEHENSCTYSSGQNLGVKITNFFMIYSNTIINNSSAVFLSTYERMIVFQNMVEQRQNLTVCVRVLTRWARSCSARASASAETQHQQTPGHVRVGFMTQDRAKACDRLGVCVRCDHRCDVTAHQPRTSFLNISISVLRLTSAPGGPGGPGGPRSIVTSSLLVYC